MEFLELLQQPFMLRAIYGGTLVAVLCAMLGVFLTLKKESFLADAVAHASLAGVALAFLISAEPIIIALIVGVLMSAGITYFKKHTKIATDSIIGMFYSMLFALGIILINLSKEYQPELSTYLFGSILSITWVDVGVSFMVFLISVVIIYTLFSKLVYTTFDPEAAYVRGIKTDRLEYLLNILTSVVIIISIKVVGIILVTALLIIPSTTAKLIAKNFRQMIPISVIQSIISVIVGVILSYYLDVPTGATIVLASGMLFIAVFALKQLKEILKA